MKKVKELSVIILMIVILMILSINVEATTGTINSETVRLRKEPNTSSTILEQLDKGHEVEILEQSEGWYKVKVNVQGKNITGYISEKLVDSKEKIEPIENETEPEIKEPEVKEPEIEEPVVEVEPITTTIPTSTEIDEKNQYVLEQELEIRAMPLINSKIKAKVNGNITVIEKINNWCRIENDINTGWVRINQLKKLVTNMEMEQNTEQPESEQQIIEEQDNKGENINKKGYVDAEGLIVREEPSKTSKEIDSLSRNDEVEIIEEVNGWYKIKLNGKTGYVSSKYISDTKTAETTSRSGDNIQPENITPMEGQTTSSEEVTGTKVVEYAKQFLKCKYVTGGTTPSTGFDCSGFTQYVYQNFGVSLNRTSGGQMKNGVSVEKDNLQLGDIVIFNNDGNTEIGHVGIYVGDNNFIHASNQKDGVKITSLATSYYSKRYVGARRVI